ncbi:MAG: hypothetical protein V4618_19130 [Pseudomonadota bacterium]
MFNDTHISAAADLAIERYGKRAPDALAELITAAVRLDDDDLAMDFDRILRRVEVVIEQNSLFAHWGAAVL